MSDYGREVCTIVEIDAKQCQLEYGTTNAAGTCAAQLGPDGGTVGSPPVANTGNRKCYNTRATCQDPDNYLPETQVIRFSHPQRGLTKHYDNVFPFLTADTENPVTTPGAVNLGGMDRSLSALGAREVVDVTLQDARWNDHLFDKYRLERISGDASLLAEGTASAGAASSLTLEDAEDAEVWNLLRLTAGAGSVQERTIASMAGAVATVSPRWRTNLCQRSEAFDHADWTKTEASIVADGALAPDGEATADYFVPSTNAAAHFVTQAIASTTDGRVMSVRVKVDSAVNKVTMFPGDGGTFAHFNLATMTTSKEVNVTSAEIEELDDGWLRLKGVWPASLTLNICRVYASSGTLGASATAGDGSSGIYLWGAQPEQHATEFGDYIKTEAAAITLPDATTDYSVHDAFDPAERGTFWGKFIRRNPYSASYRARVRRGFMGQALEDMDTRSYIVDRITGPKNGRVSMVLKDLFSLIEARKAVAPVASNGELFAGITDIATSATLSPSGIGDAEYPASGHIAINDEVMSFTRSADALTITRAQLNTEADAHDAEDVVQLVLSFSSELVQDIIYTLLTTYAEIPVANINKTEWDTLAAAAGMDDLYTARIIEPTPVKDLIGELCEQAGCTVWHDPASDMIKFRPLRPSSGNVTVTDREWIIDGTLDIQHQDSKRVSRAAVYFAQRNPTIALDDRRNFRQRVVTIDADSEGAQQYGVPAIKEIFSRWIPQFASALATEVGERHVALFRDPPLQASFRVFRDRDGELNLAEAFFLETFEAQDDTGAVESNLLAPVEIARGENEIEIKAQGVTFFTAPGDTGTRTIQLNSTDMRNLNLRTIHDSIYAAPTGDEVITFILPLGFTVGSTSTGAPALTTGSWPAGVTLTLQVDGRTQGKGGVGGTGGAQNVGSAGNVGGTALQATYAITLTGSGEIFGGGGGGGGGGAVGSVSSRPNGGGGGGGGGSGTDGGSGGGGGDGIDADGGTGSTGTADAGGGGGAGGDPIGTSIGGVGGTGGGPGLSGNTGGVGSGGAQHWSGGAGGASGASISGVSFVTVDGGATLDIRGPQS